MAEEVKKDNLIIPGTRLCFVDPSKVNGTDKTNTVEFTPPYEDMCVAFDLIIEKYDRMDPDVRNTLQFQATSKDNSNNTNNDGIFSVLQGELKTKDNKIWEGNIDNADNNYLTTYYTEISADGYTKKEKIEGLGVESIQVNYDNYYMPTVVIKFIDVRGAAIFGREEAIHTDIKGSGKINAENVFGTFFTIPYPKFRLQIKGFYGNAVTYQLTCTGIDGSFNAKTGNFEVVAKFIGYNWGILTDIPFVYLVAAPLCNYVGASYWAKHQNDEAWQMKNSPDSKCTRTQPPKLIELIEDIKSCLIKKDESSSDNITESYERESLSAKRQLLGELQNSIKEFNDSADNKTILTVDDNFDMKKTQSFFNNIESKLKACKESIIGFANDFNIDEKWRKGKGVKVGYKTLTETVLKDKNEILIDNKIEAKTDKYILTNDALYKVDYGVFQDVNQKVFYSNMHYYVKLSDNIIDLRNFDKTNYIVSNIENGIAKIDFTSGILKNKYLYYINNEKIYGLVLKVKDINDNYRTNTITTSKINQYYVLDFSSVLAEIEDTKKRFDIEEKSIIENEYKEFVKASLDKIGIEPNIYNIFKILMCHLETLTQILFECGKRINEQKLNGLRTAKALGLKGIEDSDIPSRYDEGTPLPPWTAVFNSEKDTVNTEYKIEYSTQYKWVGDLQGEEWEEAKVVLSFMKAYAQVIEQGETTESKNDDKLNGIWTFPSDIVHSKAIFEQTGSTTDGICGILGIRVAQLFGIMDRNINNIELVKTIGELDAYNYYKACNNTDELKIRFGLDENNPLSSDVVIGVTSCDNNYSNYANITSDKENYRFIFENERYDDNSRQPIFKKVNENYQYTYFKDKDDYSLVPSILKDFNNKGYKDCINVEVDNDKLFFKGEIDKQNDYYDETYGWLYANKNQILKETNSQYVLNEDMFKIIDDEKTINDLKIKYKKLKIGNFKIYDYEVNGNDKFNDFVNRYWNTSYNDFKKTINTNFVSTFIGRSIDKIENINFCPFCIEKGKKIYNKNDDKIKKDGKIWYELLTEYNDKDYIRYQLADEENDEELIFKINNGTETVKLDELYVKALYVYTYNAQLKQTSCGTLFNHPFYQMQKSKYAKALLFLQSLKRNCDFKIGDILNCEHGKLAISSKLEVLYIGGLLWKYDNSGEFLYKKGKDSYVSYEKEDALMRDGGLLVLRPTEEGKRVFKRENIKTFKDVTGINVSDIDDNVKQQLIFYFKHFADIIFAPKIMSECENLALNSNDDRKTSPYFTKYKSGDYEYYIFNNNEKGLLIQNIIKDILFKEVLIVTNGNVSNEKNIIISSNIYKNYLESFLTTIKNICNKSDNVDETYNISNTDEEKIKEKNTLVSFYIYLKNLWEKWLVQVSSVDDANEKSDKKLDIERFLVKTFFEENFVFIDSYYNDIGTKLKINLENFYQIYNNGLVDKNLYSLIGDIVKEHRCLFVGLPDYVSMGIGIDGHDARGRENLKNLFKPIPYNAMRDFNIDNHFVVIYTYPPASEMPQEYAHRFDGFDLYALDVKANNNISTDEESISIEATEDIKKIMGDVNNTELTKYGYNIPSFAVSFGKQNNSIFKDFSISMKNPVMTEAAIKTMVNVMDKAQQANRAVCFYGQDIFSIYSNYSYSIEVEMMGCAQIQPLMYFQLLNIPMWRGAYMIYKVSHNMTPGNMTTRFTAMKMSKNPVPILSSYFNYPFKLDGSSNTTLTSDAGSYIQGTKYAFDFEKIFGIESLTASENNMIRGISRNCTINKDNEKYFNKGHNKYIPNLTNDLIFEMKGGSYNLSHVINYIYNHSFWDEKNCKEKNCGQSTSWCARYVLLAVKMVSIKQNMVMVLMLIVVKKRLNEKLKVICKSCYQVMVLMKYIQQEALYQVLFMQVI